MVLSELRGVQRVDKVFLETAVHLVDSRSVVKASLASDLGKGVFSLGPGPRLSWSLGDSASGRGWRLSLNHRRAENPA